MTGASGKCILTMGMEFYENLIRALTVISMLLSSLRLPKYGRELNLPSLLQLAIPAL